MRRNTTRRLSRTLLPLLVVLGGCQAAAFTPLYLLRGLNVDAECTALKGKRVAVVCKPSAALQFNATTAADELTKRVSRHLADNVPKIVVIDADKVAEWSRENSWDEFEEVGRAMDAQIVVGIDLDGFSLYEGQTLYKGVANCNLRVYDLEAGGDPIFEKQLPPYAFPPNASIPVSEKTESEFRRQFVGHLSKRIAAHFYPHDPTLDMAMDSQALQ